MSDRETYEGLLRTRIAEAAIMRSALEEIVAVTGASSQSGAIAREALKKVPGTDIGDAALQTELDRANRSEQDLLTANNGLVEQARELRAERDDLLAALLASARVGAALAAQLVRIDAERA